MSVTFSHMLFRHHQSKGLRIGICINEPWWILVPISISGKEIIPCCCCPWLKLPQVPKWCRRWCHFHARNINIFRVFHSEANRHTTLSSFYEFSANFVFFKFYFSTLAGKRLIFPDEYLIFGKKFKDEDKKTKQILIWPPS
jgi:hypothetical protein